MTRPRKNIGRTKLRAFLPAALTILSATARLAVLTVVFAGLIASPILLGLSGVDDRRPMAHDAAPWAPVLAVFSR